MTIVLSFAASSGDDPRTLALCMLRDFAADESFVDLNFAGKLAAVLALLGESDPVEHKPCGLLSNAQGRDAIS